MSRMPATYPWNMQMVKLCAKNDERLHLPERMSVEPSRGKNLGFSHTSRSVICSSKCNEGQLMS